MIRDFYDLHRAGVHLGWQDVLDLDDEDRRRLLAWAVEDAKRERQELEKLRRR